MKRYKVKMREIWNITREIEANDKDEAKHLCEEGPEIARERVGSSECEAFNTVEEI
jgi:hypothetical protein